MVSREILSEIKRAGCQLICFGVESGSQEILNAMRKGITIEQSERAVQLAKEAGLLVAVGLMLGYPGETLDTIRQTLRFIRRVKPGIVYLNFATPFPGTEFYSYVKSLGWELSKNWESYDVVTPVFENPDLSGETLLTVRGRFYREWYSIGYFFKHLLKRNFYSRTMARFAVDYMIRRVKSKFS